MVFRWGWLIGFAAVGCLNLPDEGEDARFACESATDCVSGFDCVNGLCCRPENAMLCGADAGTNPVADTGQTDDLRDTGQDSADTGVPSAFDSGMPAADTGGLADARPALLRNGAACTDNDACESNHCTEGVCCDQACGGECESCLNSFTAGTTGQCRPVQVGLERNDECADEQTCNGTGACFYIACPTETPVNFDRAEVGSTAVAGWRDFDLQDWADNGNVACYVTFQGDQYRGPYQVYTIDIVSPAQWDVVVTPDSGVDVSLVAWQDDVNGCAPIRDIGVRTCEASNRNGAGGEERVSFVALNSGYRIVIVVTTPNGGTRGGFTITVEDTP